MNDGQQTEVNPILNPNTPREKTPLTKQPSPEEVITGIERHFQRAAEKTRIEKELAETPDGTGKKVQLRLKSALVTAEGERETHPSDKNEKRYQQLTERLAMFDTLLNYTAATSPPYLGRMPTHEEVLLKPLTIYGLIEASDWQESQLEEIKSSHGVFGMSVEDADTKLDIVRSLRSTLIDEMGHSPAQPNSSESQPKKSEVAKGKPKTGKELAEYFERSLANAKQETNAGIHESVTIQNALVAAALIKLYRDQTTGGSFLDFQRKVSAIQVVEAAKELCAKKALPDRLKDLPPAKLGFALGQLDIAIGIETPRQVPPPQPKPERPAQPVPSSEQMRRMEAKRLADETFKVGAGQADGVEIVTSIGFETGNGFIKGEVVEHGNAENLKHQIIDPEDVKAPEIKNRVFNYDSKTDVLTIHPYSTRVSVSRVREMPSSGVETLLRNLTGRGPKTELQTTLEPRSYLTTPFADTGEWTQLSLISPQRESTGREGGYVRLSVVVPSEIAQQIIENTMRENGGDFVKTYFTTIFSEGGKVATKLRPPPTDIPVQPAVIDYRSGIVEVKREGTFYHVKEDKVG